MKRLTKVGILILVIGLSFFVSTFYRSTFGLDFTTGDLFGLKPHTWSYDGNSTMATPDMVPGNFLPPRDYRIEVKSNTAIDLYLLDAEGLRLWASEGKLEPVMAFDGVRQEVFTFHLNNRGQYWLLFTILRTQSHSTNYPYQHTALKPTYYTLHLQSPFLEQSSQ